jgi:hypothetical protein
MKTIVTISAAILLFIASSTVKAQESRAGIKGGLNLSSMTTDGNDDKNLKPGFHLGVFNKISTSESFAIQPELLYSVKGIKYDYDESVFADGETRFNLHYLELPVKLVFNLSEDFEFQFGPYVSYLIWANLDTDADVLDFFEIDSEDEIDRKRFNAFDYGLTAGLGFDLDPLIIGVNYNLGLNPVAKEDEPSREILGDAKNTTIMVSVGLKF